MECPVPNVVTKIYSLGKEVLFIMKKRKFSKVIAVALAAIMVVGMVPMTALAADAFTKTTGSNSGLTSENYTVSLQGGDDYINLDFQDVAPDGTISVDSDEDFNITMTTVDGFASEPDATQFGWYANDKASSGRTISYYEIVSDTAFSATVKDAETEEEVEDAVTITGFGETASSEVDSTADNSTLTSTFSVKGLEEGTYEITLNYKLAMKYHYTSIVTSGSDSSSNYVTPSDNGTEIASETFTITVGDVDDTQGGTTEPEPTPDPTPTPDPEPEAGDSALTDATYYSESLKYADGDDFAYINFQYDDVDAETATATFTYGDEMVITMDDGAGWNAAGKDGENSLGWYIYSTSAYNSNPSYTSLSMNADDKAVWTATLTDESGDPVDGTVAMAGFPDSSEASGMMSQGTTSSAGSTINTTFTLPEGLAVGTYTLDLTYTFRMKYASDTIKASWHTITNLDGSDEITIVVCDHGSTTDADLVAKVPATCSDNGCGEHYVCPDCGMLLVKDEDENFVTATAEDLVIPATGEHSFIVDGVATPTEKGEDATCTKEGKEATYTCETCGKTYIQVVGDDDEISYVEATDENVVIPTTEHNYNSVVLLKSTCTERGCILYTCSICGDQYAEETPALGHDYVDEVTEAATCEDTGILTKTCSRCGDVVTETIDALGHDYDYENATFEWSEDHRSCTATAICGNDPSHIDVKDCTVTTERTPATWEEDGQIVYTATFTYTYYRSSIFGGQTEVTAEVSETYTEVIPMFGDNATQLDGGLVKVVEDENVSIKTNTPEYSTFDIVASVAGLLDVEFNDVVAEDDVDISFNYTGLNEDGTISVAEDATEVSFGIEDFSCVYAASATISSDEIYDKVNEIIAMFADGKTLDELITEELGSFMGAIVVPIIKAIISPVEITPEFIVVTPVYTVTATDADGNVYYFDVAYDEDDAGYTGNATFICENIPAGDYTVSVDYTYDIAFTYDELYSDLNALLELLADYVDLSTVLGDYADMIVGNLEIPISGTANIRSISSSDEFGLALEKTIGSEGIIIEVEEREDGLTKTRTGAEISFVGGSDEAGTFDVSVNVLGMLPIDFTDVVASDDLNISFNYSGLNETGTLTVGEDASVASFGVENFTYDYSALAKISSTAIVDVVVDLLGTFGVDMSDYASLLYGAVPDVDLTADSAAITATYTVYATAADGTVYPFSVVYDGNNATFTCYNIPAGEYDVTVEYAFDISFDYDTLYTGITDLLANPLVAGIITGLGDEIAGMLDGLDLDIAVSGTAESVRVINSSDSIPTTVLADIENEDVPSAGGESGSGESGSGESGESGETSEPCEHDFYIVASAEATCEDEGWVLYACSICGEQFVQYTAALGHDFVDGVCTRCGALEEEPAAAGSASSSKASTSTSGEAEGEEEFEEVEDEDEFTEVEEDEFEVVEDEDLTSPATGASMAAIATAMAFAAAGVVVVTRKKKEDEE